MVLYGNALVANWFEELVYRKAKEAVRGRSKRNEESPEAINKALGFIA